MRFSTIKSAILMSLVMGLYSGTANAWVSGGIVLSAPVAPYYPAPVYAYPPPYPYPYPPAPVPYAYPAYPQAPSPAAPQNLSNDTGGHECRDYSRTIYIGGEPQQAFGHACRQPDGKWQIMD